MKLTRFCGNVASLFNSPLPGIFSPITQLGWMIGALVVGSGCTTTRAPNPDPQVAQVSIANSTDFTREQEPLFFSFYDLGLQPEDARVPNLVVREGDALLPSQLLDRSGDGDLDSLLTLLTLAPGEEIHLRVLADPKGARALKDLPQQTQAEIAHKVNGQWQANRYTGGEFNNVQQLTPPPQYTDHSEWIRYEGPGIESDKVGYRLYLDWRNGLDIFGKKTPDMVLQDVGQDGYQSYHEMQDWGMDILKVGLSLGAGGFGFWDGEQVQLVSDVARHTATIVANGPLYSAFTVDYQDWSINDQTLDLRSHFSMTAGSRLVHTRLSLSEGLPNMAIGMVKHPETELIQGEVDISGYAWTYTASWGKQSLSDPDSYLGMAVLYRRGDRSEQAHDDNSYVSVMRVPSGELEYYFLAAWDGEPDGINSREAFVDYLDREVARLTVQTRQRSESALSRAAKDQPMNGKTALRWAQGLADSELERKTLLYHADGWDTHRRRVPKFEYDIVGLQPMAYHRLNQQSPNPAYAQVPHKVTGSFVTDDGEIRNYQYHSFNIDSIKPGMVLLDLYRETGEQKYRQAADLLRQQLHEHPRTKEGAFWHKQTYPHQVWLDGVYMGMPFLAQYSVMFEDGASLEEVIKEFQIVYQRLRDTETGLYYHAWDESRQMNWADPVTGLSPHFWGRGLGWYAMALVDVLDIIPEERTDLRAPLLQYAEELAQALVNYQDPATGTWFQIMDQPERVGNYRESSATAMFTYFFARAVHGGYLPEPYTAVAVRAFEGMINEFVTVHPDGLISMTHQCLVAGLGFGRDGSYEYYMSERVVSNDPKGNGPFILAGVALYQLLGEAE